MGSVCRLVRVLETVIESRVEKNWHVTQVPEATRPIPEWRFLL